ARAEMHLERAIAPLLHKDARSFGPNGRVVAARLFSVLETGAVGLAGPDEVGQRAAGCAVDGDVGAHGAAEQFVYRLPRDLAGNVPERNVDPADRTHLDRPALVARPGAVHDIPQVFDTCGVLAD